MKRLIVGSTLAMAVTFAMVASAQTTPQQAPPQSPQPTAQAEQKMPDESVTVVGCVQKESDYRQANNLGKGGAVGTGAGAGDEFVLIAAAKIPAGAPGATGTSGGTIPAGTDAFELTGDKEDDVKAFVGKRVEIMGKLKAAKTEAGAPTGGATAAVPGSSDLKLRELDVVSVKETAGTCPAASAK